LFERKGGVSSGVQARTKAPSHEHISIGAGDPTNIIIRPKRAVTKDDDCTIHLPANSFVLSSGATNPEPLDLRNYIYY